MRHWGLRRGGERLEPKAALTAIHTTPYTWDLSTDEIAWAPNAAEVLDIPHVGVFPDGTSLAMAVEPQGGDSRADAIADSKCDDARDGVPYRVRYALRTRPDRLVMVEDAGRWFADANGRPALARGTMRVEQGVSGEDSLASSLRARSTLLAQIAGDVSDARRSRHSLTLVVGSVTTDEDHDHALVVLADAMRPLMRRRDRFIPYGLGRFAIALASCTAEDALQAVERLFALAGPHAAELGLRLGAASAPDHALDAPALLRHAEAALARAAGLFAVYAPPEMRPIESSVGTSPYAIVDALNGRRLVAAHRPVLDPSTGEPVFATLVPQIGADGPSSQARDLRLAAERAGLSSLLDARLLELAADFLGSRLLPRVVLPISTQSLYDPEWLTTLAAHLGARPGIESRLIIDVPEAVLRDLATRGRLNAMKALGVGIMVSGFGAGQSGLKDLRQMPIDLLKIDGTLIETLDRSTDDRLLVHRLVDLAHHLGLPTVAEWVAHEASARLLTEWGVDYIEGPFCGAAALPADARERRQALAG